jgi:hypothetical protein
LIDVEMPHPISFQEKGSVQVNGWKGAIEIGDKVGIGKGVAFPPAIWMMSSKDSA